MFHASPFYLTSHAHVTKNQCGDFSPFCYWWWDPRPLWMRHSFWSIKVLMPITGRFSFSLWFADILSDNDLSLGCSCGGWGRCGRCHCSRVCCFWKKSSSLWKRERGFPLLFDQTCEKEDEVFLSCLTKLFRENTSSDENKSSQVLGGASGANTGHFASFFYYTRYNIIAIDIIIVLSLFISQLSEYQLFIILLLSIRARALLEGELAAEARITLFSLHNYCNYY